MHSKAYQDAKKEFINCLVLSPLGLFLPIFIAFKEWWPIMQAEKKKKAAA